MSDSARIRQLKLRAEKLLREHPGRAQNVPADESAKLIHDMQVYHAEIEIQNEELRQAQLKLQEALEKFTALYHRAPVGYVSVDDKGIVREANETFALMLCKPRDAIMNKPLHQFLHADERSVFLGKLKAMVAVPDGKQFETRLLHTSPSEVTCLVTAAKGLLAGQVLLTLMDISAQKQAEAGLRLSSRVVESTSDAVLITDAEGNIISVNDSFIATTGYAKEEVVGHNPRLLQSGKQGPEFYQRMWQEILSQGRWSGIVWNKKKSGDLYAEQLTINAISGEGGKVENYVGVFSDITEQIKYEQHLREIQKMESVGTMVGGVAHDFNNMLAGILSTTYLMKQKVNEPLYIREKLENIESLGNTAADLIKKMLAFARKSPVSMKSVRIRSFIGEVMAIIRPSVPANIELMHDIDLDERLEINLDPTLFQQVIFNLISNAVHSLRLSEHPLLHVRAGSIDVAGLPESIKSQAMHNSYIYMAFEDNGAGMDSETLRRAFEPFFTTKAVGEGTGLGLSMVLGAVQMHEGAVDIHSKPGEGTTVSLYFPLHAEEAEFTSPEIDAYAAPEINLPRLAEKTILIVDDNDRLRSLLVELLTAAGTRCYEAINGAEAIRFFIKHRDSLSLIISDLVMPKVGGLELAKRVAEIDSRFPIILISGYEQQQSDACFEHGQVKFMAKPFDPGLLMRLIDELIEEYESKA